MHIRSALIYARWPEREYVLMVAVVAMLVSPVLACRCFRRLCDRSIAVHLTRAPTSQIPVRLIPELSFPGGLIFCLIFPSPSDRMMAWYVMEWHDTQA